MQARRYTFVFLAVLACCLGGVATFNAGVDPLWLFAHASSWNSRQVGFDERQQKTNRITFGGFDYDAVLLGSSRVTFIDQHDFPGMKVFNYAASGMRPEEYAGYVRYARERGGGGVKTVIVGIDFFGTNRNYGGRAASPEHYVGVSRRPLYRLESLISLDTLKRSQGNLKARGEDCDCYGRDNVKRMVRPQGERKAQILTKDLAVFRREIYGPSYAYDDSLAGQWRRLVDENPGIRFVVFTTPISHPLFATLVDTGHLPHYERWLTEVVAAFGEVYDFMGANSITGDKANYQDGGHFYPEVGRLVALRLFADGSGVPPDFGVRVTRDNLERHLESMRQQAVRAVLAEKAP